MSDNLIIKEHEKKENGIPTLDEEKELIEAKKKIQSDIKENQEKAFENSAEDEKEDASDEANDSKMETELKLSLDESKDCTVEKDDSLQDSKEEESMDESKEDIKDESLDHSKEESQEDSIGSHEESLEDSKSEALDDSKVSEDAKSPKKRKRRNFKEPPREGTVKSKRERKTVERLSLEPKKEVEVKGFGEALGDIPYVNAMLSKTLGEELKVLHRLCYGRPGRTAIEVKKNLRKFSGFPIEKDDKLSDKKRQIIEKVNVPELKKILTIFGLERSGQKPDLIQRVLIYLLKPEDFGKPIPDPKKKPKRTKKQSRKPRSKKAKVEKDESKVDDDAGTGISSLSDDDDDIASEKNGSDSEEEGGSAASPAPKKTPKAKKAPSAKSSEKKASAKKTKMEDDIPLAKMKKPQPPSDNEIKVFIKKLLDKANLEEVTMKKLCQQVYDNYPKFDLTHKKDFIKETVKSILS